MKGISHNKRNNTWIVRITFDGALYYIGTYKSESDAAVAYEVNYNKLNGNPNKSHVLPARIKRTPLSEHKYVSWNKKLLKWAVYIPVDGKRKFFGNFVDKFKAIDVVKKHFRYSRRKDDPKFEYKEIVFLAKDTIPARIKIRRMVRFGWEITFDGGVPLQKGVGGDHEMMVKLKRQIKMPVCFVK